MNEEIKGIGIPCGYNPLSFGEVVDEDEPIFGEAISVFYGNMLFGELHKLAQIGNENEYSLSELWNGEKDRIPAGSCLYVIVTDALSGTIYACGHSKRGEWTVFAKTAGYV